MGKFAKKNNKSVKEKVPKQTKNMSRKELRKEKRREKKERKNQHYQKKFLNIKNEIKNEVLKNRKNGGITNTNAKPNNLKMSVPKVREVSHSKENASQNKTSSFEQQSLEHKNEIIEQKNLEKEMKVQRKKQLLLENKNEDKFIKKLEKQLRLNKRKSKTLPQSFMDEGLDYLLDVCDSDKIKSAVETEKNLQDSDSEFDEDFAVVTGKKKKNTKERKNNSVINESISEDDSDTSNDCVSDFDGSEVGEALIEETDGDIEGDEYNDGDGDGKNNFEENSDDEMEFDDDSSDDEFPPSKKLKVCKKVSQAGKNKGVEDNSDSDQSEFSEDSTEKGGEEIDRSGDENKGKKEVVVYEDIYGRKRDKHGNIIPESGKYIPPHLKAQLMKDSGREEQLVRLRKQIKGLLNRLAENNMHSIVSQMDQLFMQNSRNDMNDTLTKLIFESLIQPVLVPDRLVVEHTMLIAALHANVGTEVGAHFLQAVVEKFDSLYKINIDIANKEVDNILLIIAHLYSFKVFNCVLMFDILNRLTGVAEFGEKEVELLLIVLRRVGFNLRKDDPVALKNIILKVQSVVNNSSNLLKQSRVRFMLDTLMAIKNNNMSKVPNYDPVQIEHHKKILKNLVQKGKYISELNITLEDLLKAPERGRWWVVGSAWSGGDVKKSNNSENDENATNDISQTYLDLAKKHRMSTDTRRNIFCIIMSAEDYMDAFEKLLRLGLKGPQEQTIIHVIVHCLLQEKTFNPYYAYLASQFCTADRKHLMTLQYHLWDRIRELDDLKGFQITNLALFLSHLILEKALPLSVLKVIEFATLSKSYVRLLRRILLTILLHQNDETVAEIFQRISRAPKLKLFRESIRLFFHHFILRNIIEDSNQMVKLKERVHLAENCMNFVS